jgi:hypothetical protein
MTEAEVLEKLSRDLARRPDTGVGFVGSTGDTAPHPTCQSPF